MELKNSNRQSNELFPLTSQNDKKFQTMNSVDLKNSEIFNLVNPLNKPKAKT